MMTADVFLIADSRFHDCRLQIYFDCRLKISGLQTADVGVPRNIRLQILNLKIAPV